MSDIIDYVVIGGGIVGLSTAYRLKQKNPRAHIVLIDKETAVAKHQTGRNSGVIHSGIYYKPQSLKAKLCVEGRQALLRFCSEQGIPYDLCGKVIVATNRLEQATLKELESRAVLNGVRGVRSIDREELREREPHVAGVNALWVPDAGIVDYRLVAKALQRCLGEMGVKVALGVQAYNFQKRSRGWILQTDQGELSAQQLVFCAGIHGDSFALQAFKDLAIRLYPFRGEFYALKPHKRSLVRGLVYPAPDMRVPFLGVHLTKQMGGGVLAGPNAVLALKKEGYLRHQVDLTELWEMLKYPGFWRFASKFWKTGLEESLRSSFKSLFVRSLQRLVPALSENDLETAASGIRAQGLREDGLLEDDFHIVQRDGAFFILNVPSPAATSSLAIGEYLARTVTGKVESKFQSVKFP